MIDAVLLLVLYALMWRVLFAIIRSEPGPDDRPAPWPSGVVEGDPVRYAVEAIKPRTRPAPADDVEPVGATEVQVHVRVVAR